MLNFAIVGLGGLGQVHLSNYNLIKKAKNVRLTALCDVEKSRFETKVGTNLGENKNAVDMSEFNQYTDLDEMLEHEKLDFVITAVPTYLHESVAVKIMNKGIHVFSEKPMALNLEKCMNMIEAAKKNNVRLQIGQCCRFEEQRINLKKILDEGKYGKVIRAEFSRFSLTPKWAWRNWYLDFEKSGGAALDLHVHDVDCMNWLFGVPKAVMSAASHALYKFESISSNFLYDGFYVTTRTDWSMSDKFGFKVVGLVNLEKATIVFEENGALTVYTDEETLSIPCNPDSNMYADEVTEFIDCIENNRDSNVISPESTMLSIKLALAEQSSAEKGEVVYVQ